MNVDGIYDIVISTAVAGSIGMTAFLAHNKPKNALIICSIFVALLLAAMFIDLSYRMGESSGREKVLTVTREVVYADSITKYDKLERIYKESTPVESGSFKLYGLLMLIFFAIMIYASFFNKK